MKYFLENHMYIGDDNYLLNKRNKIVSEILSNHPAYGSREHYAVFEYYTASSLITRSDINSMDELYDYLYHEYLYGRCKHIFILYHKEFEKGFTYYPWFNITCLLNRLLSNGYTISVFMPEECVQSEDAQYCFSKIKNIAREDR